VVRVTAAAQTSVDALAVAQTTVTGALQTALRSSNAAQVGQLASAVADLLNMQAGGVSGSSLQEAVTLRASLIASLSSVTNAASASGAAQQLQALSSVVQLYSQLNSAAVGTGAALVQNLVNGAQSATTPLSPSAAQAAVSAVSNLLAALNGTVSGAQAATASAQLVSSVNGVTARLLRELACGQTPAFTATGGLATLAQKAVTTSAGAGLTVGGTRFDVPLSALGGSACVGMQATHIERRRNPYAYTGVEYVDCG
jgi:hypothetical protein